MDGEQLTREVIKASASLKEKYRAFKRGEEDKDIVNRKRFKTLIEPLKSIEETLKKPGQEEKKTKHGGKTSKQDESKSEVTSMTDVTPTKMSESLSEANKRDILYGLRYSRDGRTMLGSSEVEIDEDSNVIFVDGESFQGTPGLFDLLFHKKPKVYTKKDLEQYRLMLELSNAHRKGYEESNSINRNNSLKYRVIISKLFPPTVKKRGSGLMSLNQGAYPEYWNDVNELVDRLRLLLSSQKAGDNSHSNEVESILEELKEEGYIR